MGVSTFKLAQWVEAKAPDAKHNLAGSACPGLSVKDLINLSTDGPTTASNLDFGDLKLNYNSSNSGQAALKQGIASLLTTPIKNHNILSTIGASIANHVVLQALLQLGDHVICVQPTYSQLYAIPGMLGADISTWHHQPSKEWQLDFHELEGLIRNNTKMITVNNPNNPTGTYLPDELQRQVISLAKKHNITILADEIFRPLFHVASSSSTTTPTTHLNGNITRTIPKSFLDNAHDLEYTNVVITGSMSKSWSFPGLRIGWIISRDDAIVKSCTNLRLYMVNSVSPIDELIASEALSERCQSQIKAANLARAQAGLDVLEDFVVRSQKKQEPRNSRYRCEWVKPLASSTTLIRFVHRSTGEVLDDVKLCQAVFDQERVLLVPASLCFDMANLGDTAGVDASAGKGWMRIGFVAGAEHMTECLGRVEKFLDGYEET